MTDVTSTDVATIEDENRPASGFDIGDAIAKLASGQATVYSTFQGDDFDTKIALLEAVTNSEPIAENLNKRIDIVNLVIQPVEMADEQTGEMREVPRVILIDENGVAYHAISMGIYRAVETVLGIVGQPHTWPHPLPVKLVREGKAPRAYFTIKNAKNDAKAK